MQEQQMSSRCRCRDPACDKHPDHMYYCTATNCNNKNPWHHRSNFTTYGIYAKQPGKYKKQCVDRQRASGTETNRKRMRCDKNNIERTKKSNKTENHNKKTTQALFKQKIKLMQIIKYDETFDETKLKQSVEEKVDELIKRDTFLSQVKKNNPKFIHAVFYIAAYRCNPDRYNDEIFNWARHTGSNALPAVTMKDGSIIKRAVLRSQFEHHPFNIRTNDPYYLDEIEKEMHHRFKSCQYTVHGDKSKGVGQTLNITCGAGSVVPNRHELNRMFMKSDKYKDDYVELKKGCTLKDKMQWVYRLGYEYDLALIFNSTGLREGLVVQIDPKTGSRNQRIMKIDQ